MKPMPASCGAKRWANSRKPALAHGGTFRNSFSINQVHRVKWSSPADQFTNAIYGVHRAGTA